ncbi:hypothetical protein [Streptomyces sp. NPDC093111]|uniref:hypothetical protein n=1 Tax=Streptomyces sp. NPDC093111 TaxID=3154978 RepID=UPI00342244DD
MSIVAQRLVGARAGGGEDRQEPVEQLEAARQRAQAALVASQEAARKLAEAAEQAGGAR